MKTQMSFLIFIAGLLVGCSIVFPPPFVPIPTIDKKITTELTTIPSIGEKKTVVVGENMYEEFIIKRRQTKKITLLDDAIGYMDLGNSFKLPRGTTANLSKTFRNGYIAMCPSARTSSPMGSFAYCLVDTQGNGEFDKSMFANRLKFFPLANPVKYIVENKIETIVEKSEFKQEVLYQGYTKGTIKISFREFIKDMARPAFTQDISYDQLSDGTFFIAFKDLRIKVYKATNSDITYEVVKPFSDSSAL